METLRDPFLLTLAAATILRGLGAGIITGVELITLPARRRLGPAPYARFACAHFQGRGVGTYAVVTALGTVVLQKYFGHD